MISSESHSETARILEALEIGDELFWEPSRQAIPGAWTGHLAIAFWLIKGRGDEHAGLYGEEVFRELHAFNESHFAGFSKLLSNGGYCSHIRLKSQTLQNREVLRFLAQNRKTPPSNTATSQVSADSRLTFKWRPILIEQSQL
jgi:hypothetical protein